MTTTGTVKSRDRLPPPSECGLPEKFTRWRPRQDEAIFRAAESEKRFVVLCMPTGSGKSLTYMAVAALTGLRTCVLTSTKGLQEQLSGDFAPMGLVDMRGRGNYPCQYLIEEDKLTVLRTGGDDRTPMCDIGPCTAGMACSLKGEGRCDYFNAVFRARQSNYVISNYAYWLHTDSNRGEENEGMGIFDCLVLDEAHNAPEDLGNFLAVEITRNQTTKLDLEWPDAHRHEDDWDYWREWADMVSKAAKAARKQIEPHVQRGVAKRSELKDYKEFKRLESRMNQVAASQGEWVQHEARRGDRGLLTLHFDPVWPGEYAEKNLFRGTGKVIMTSATVRPKTLELLGVPANQVDFVEFPSTFPVERRPIYYLPTVRVDNRAGADLMKIWVTKIDNIIRARLNRKGIIHTVSYARADFILRHSEFAHLMLTHDTASARRMIETFKRSSAPCVLVSPSVSTGVDFPYDECRYQIIGKIPFPDSRDKIVKARSALDPEYSYYLAMQVLVQSTGRGMRSADDACETFIIDDHATWFMSKWGAKLAPRWFMQSYKRGSGIPEAIKL